MSIQGFFYDLFRVWIPNNLITDELSGIYGSNVLANMEQIIKYYNIYENGAEFVANTDSDYKPAELHYKLIQSLIDTEARFLFCKPPEYFISPVDITPDNMQICSDYQTYINNVLKDNRISGQMVRAAKDYLIGGRIAIFVDFSDNVGIKISFVPALEFVYDVDEYGSMDKIIAFFAMNDESEKDSQRIKRKKYWLEGGKCHVSEGIYDGDGKLVETIIDNLATSFSYIPAVVVLNNALIGETEGKSEIDSLAEYEQYYNRLSNLDIDSERQGMNPIRYAMDVEPRSTEHLSLAAGAFWDLRSDVTVNDNAKGSVGILEPSMSYSSTLSTTLDRIKNTMYSQVAVPDVSLKELQGVVTSGKGLKGIYWSLITRCEEKMLDWRQALEFVTRCIIDGAKLYPNIASKYLVNPLKDVDYIVKVDNQYPLPEDEEEEKTTDMAEVSAKVRSIKSYLKKWQGMTDEEADKEIQQIAIERQIIEDSYLPNMGVGSSVASAITGNIAEGNGNGEEE